MSYSILNSSVDLPQTTFSGSAFQGMTTRERNSCAVHISIFPCISSNYAPFGFVDSHRRLWIVTLPLALCLWLSLTDCLTHCLTVTLSDWQCGTHSVTLSLQSADSALQCTDVTHSVSDSKLTLTHSLWLRLSDWHWHSLTQSHSQWQSVSQSQRWAVAVTLFLVFNSYSLITVLHVCALHYIRQRTCLCQLEMFSRLSFQDVFFRVTRHNRKTPQIWQVAKLQRRHLLEFSR